MAKRVLITGAAGGSRREARRRFRRGCCAAATATASIQICQAARRVSPAAAAARLAPVLRMRLAATPHPDSLCLKTLA